MTSTASTTPVIGRSTGAAAGDRVLGFATGFDQGRGGAAEGAFQRFVAVPEHLCLHTAIRDLAGIIPDARHVEFDGLGHDGPWNGGGTAEISAALRTFFTP